MAIPPKQRTDRVPGEIIQDEDIDSLASAINDLIDWANTVETRLASLGAGGGGTGDGSGTPTAEFEALQTRVAAIETRESTYVRGSRWDVANRRFEDGGLVLHASPWDSSATTPPAPGSNEDALWADA